MHQYHLLENAYFLLAVIRSYFPGFCDDGCTTSPDGILGYDFSWACRIHDWRYCTRCHPPDSMSQLARRFADEVSSSPSSLLVISIRWRTFSGRTVCQQTTRIIRPIRSLRLRTKNRKAMPTTVAI